METQLTRIKINKPQMVEYNHTVNSQFFINKIWRVREVANYLGVSQGHIYNLTSKQCKRSIPHRKKGKLLYFLPSEIQDWINEGQLDENNN